VDAEGGRLAVNDTLAEIVDNHRRFSAGAHQFVQFAMDHQGCEARPPFLDQDRGIPGYSDPIQAWPIFLGQDIVREFARAAVAIPKLIKTIPERLFAGKPQAFAEYYNLPNPLMAEFLLEKPTGIEGNVARVDLNLGQNGLRCLEVNMSSRLGGWEISHLAQKFLEWPCVATFLERTGLRVTTRDPLQRLFAHITTDCLQQSLADGGELTIGCIIEPEGRLIAERFFANAYAKALADLDLGLTGSIVCGPYADGVAYRNGLYFKNRRVQAILEYTVDETPRAVIRAFKAAKIALYNGPLKFILGDKRNLALLSKHEHSGIFDEAERSVIRDYIPWCREATPGPVVFEGETLEMERLLVQRQDKLVLKKAISNSGAHVAIGKNVDSLAWRDTVAKCLEDGDWIVQEYYPPLPLMFHGVEGFAPHESVWGLFGFGELYGGSFLRIAPGEGRIINSARGASDGLAFELC